MVDSLTDARLDFANHALEKLDTFNSKLSDLTNRPLPSETHPNPPFSVLHHYGLKPFHPDSRNYDDGGDEDNDYGSDMSRDNDDGSSVHEIATEVFHVDAQTQTSPHHSVISHADSEAALPPDEKLDKMQRLLKSLKDEADDIVAEAGGDLGNNVKELTEYLNSIMYKSNYTGNTGYLPPYLTMGQVGTKKDEDDVGKVKAEIRSVKGVLLNM